MGAGAQLAMVLRRIYDEKQLATLLASLGGNFGGLWFDGMVFGNVLRGAARV
jgi:hypothetical protein